MAHKKGQGSVRNGRESQSQRLGIKVFGGESVRAPAAEVVAWAEGYERFESVRTTGGGRPGTSGRRRRTISFTAWFAPKDTATVRAACI